MSTPHPFHDHPDEPTAPACSQEALAEQLDPDPTENRPVFSGSPAPALQALRAQWLPADPAGLPRLRTLALPGPRRKKQGRGGATALAVTITTLIRSPLLDRIEALFAIEGKKVGRPTSPVRYWLFYCALARELASFELADQEILAHYPLIKAEFAARGLLLPAVKPGTTNPIAGYHAFNRWRQVHVVNAGRLPEMIAAFRQSSLELAWLIRKAEGRTTGDPLSPSLGEILSGDASVFAPASDVRAVRIVSPDGTSAVTGLIGSRAKLAKDAREHQQSSDYKDVKKHGQTQGFYHLALSTKGYDTYTRVVLDVDIAQPGQAESSAAMPMLDRVLADAPDYFQVLTYDGQIVPKHALKLLSKHGVYVVNHNSLASRKPGKGHDAKQAGNTVRKHGQHKGKPVRSYFTSLPSQHHQRPDGSLCSHHMVSDDGAVYTADRAAGAGTPVKGRLLEPTALRRTRTKSRYRVELEYTLPCLHGDLTYRVRLTDTKPNKDGTIAWSSPLAAHRVIPEAWGTKFKAVFGARNQSESFFSWLEKCYFHKDRVASWGHDEPLLDLLGAAILHNTETWAHYAYRHGA